jgi:hypothetical protein
MTEHDHDADHPTAEIGMSERPGIPTPGDLARKKTEQDEREKQEAELDEALDESFPASDPLSSMTTELAEPKDD